MSDGIFAEVSGNGGQTIVLIHGFGGSHHIWAPIAASLARDNTVIAYDLPGHGRSLGYPDAGSAKVAVKAIAADLKVRGIGACHMAGHSMGGAIATLVAMFNPGLVTSLTLLAPGGFGDEINGRLLRRFASASGAEDIRACLEVMFGWSQPVPEQAVTQLAAERAEPGQRDMLMAIAGMITKDEKQGEIPRDQIAALPMPVTLMWGKQDCVLPVHQAEGMPDHFAVRLFERTGHMLPEERPSEVMEAIRARLG